MPQGELEQLWKRITAPTCLVYGEESWATNPEKDGRIAHFSTASVRSFSNAGHWVHHDRYDDFLKLLQDFL